MFLATKNSLPRPACRMLALLGALMLPAMAADPAPEDAQARFEVDYLTGMIDHHQAAVAMAELVAERTEREELREFAATLATDQAEEIARLQEWLEEWYGETHEAEPNRQAERQLAALEELEGDEFEQAFLRAMSLHHGDMLVMARDGLLRAWHSELIDLTREGVATQADEIALMRGWLQEWHDINEVTPGDRPDNRTWNKKGPRAPVTMTPGRP